MPRGWTELTKGWRTDGRRCDNNNHVVGEETPEDNKVVVVEVVQQKRQDAGTTPPIIDNQPHQEAHLTVRADREGEGKKTSWS